MYAVQKKDGILKYIISIFVLIYVSPETLLFGTNNNEQIKNVGYVIIFLLSLYWILYSCKNNIKKGKNQTYTLVVLITLSIVSMSLSVDFSIKYFYECMVLILASFFCVNVSFDIFCKYYSKIMFCLALCSVITFVIYEIAYSVLEIFPLIENTGGHEFYNMGLSFVQKKMMYYSHRNYGVFREPGVYVFYLIFAVIIELFYNNEISAKKIVTLSLATFLTFSTAGWIILFFVFFIYLLLINKTLNSGRKKFILSIMIFIGVFYILRNQNFVDEFIFHKFSEGNSSKASRFDSLWLNLRMLTSNPHGFITGLGYSYVENNFEIFADKYNSFATDNTNTIFRMLAIHGVPYVLIIVSLLANFIKKFSEQKNVVVFLFLIFLGLLFNENYMLNPILYIMTFYSFQPNVGEKKYEYI